MAQRVYWVPHTVCYFGCAHCHNDSVMEGIRASQRVIDGVIANLPGAKSPYRLEEMLVGGGEALMRGQQMEYLVRQFRERFPRGSQATIAERRAAGFTALGLQTMGHPLADRHGVPSAKLIDYWLDLGVDLFHIASNDIFHERQRPDYPWEAFRENMRRYGEQHGVEFVIYGKGPTRLVPSGRVLDDLPALEAEGAALLVSEGYCATAWEGAANFLSGQERAYPDCSEVVIDPHGWVHPCCWHELSPGLFDLSATPFEQGMERLRAAPLCHVLDTGDMAGLAAVAEVDPVLAARVRDLVGDCGACRLWSVRLSQDPRYSWLKPAMLSPSEARFYGQRLGVEMLRDAVPARSTRFSIPLDA
jgi:hypothetical protein